jgi:hypothetical protein
VKTQVFRQFSLADSTLFLVFGLFCVEINFHVKKITQTQKSTEKVEISRVFLRFFKTLLDILRHVPDISMKFPPFHASNKISNEKV